MRIRVKTHRDNWSPLVALERAGVRLDRERYQAIAIDDPDVLAELLDAVAAGAVEVDPAEVDPGELEQLGLAITPAGALVVLEPEIDPRELADGEQLEEGELPAGAEIGRAHV